MDKRDCMVYYTELGAILDDFRLGWVTRQVTDAINKGKVVENISSEGKTLDTRTEPYTEREELMLLIDATQRAVIDTTEMENELILFFENEGERLNTKLEIKFVAEEDNNSTALNADSLTTRTKAAIDLRHFLVKLRKEAMK